MNRKYLVSSTKDGNTYYYRDIEAHDKIADLSTTVDNRLDEQDDLITGIKADIENRVATGEFVSKGAVEDIVEEALKEIPVIDINKEVLKDEILEEVSGKIDNLSIEHSAIKRGIKEATVFFEVKDAPAGTLVDYNCKEIRIMCPAGTDWEGYNPPMRKNLTDQYKYLAFYAYAPDAAVSYKEVVGHDYPEFIEKENKAPYTDDGSNDTGVNSDFRKYSIYYLPVAEYRTVDGVGSWYYLGQISTIKDFNGWYYTIEWYDENGIVIKADTVRINLSTEETFRYIEPALEHSIWAKYLDLNEKYEKILEKLSLLEDTSIGVNLGVNTDPHPLIEFDYDEEYNGYILTRYNGRKEILEVPEKVEGIDVVGCSFNSTSAFKTGSTTKIIIPKTIKFIDERSFEMASHIHDIYIPLPENSIPGAPWGSTTLTVHWNYKGTI